MNGQCVEYCPAISSIRLFRGLSADVFVGTLENMTENTDHGIRPVVTVDQLARTHDVLVRELAALRDNALARHVEPAHVSRVFRRRADRLHREMTPACGDAILDTVPVQARSHSSIRHDAGDSEDGEYSVWW